MSKAHAPRRKHVPLRTCIICRQSSSKRELVRVVRTPSGLVLIDPTGKLAGRGAYLCRARSCWTNALKGDRLAAALKTHISGEQLRELLAYSDTLGDEAPGGEQQPAPTPSGSD